MNQPILREAAVTKYAFEEVYFTKDSMEGNSEYTFQFPSVWNGLPTKKKAIGFRYAKCTPSSYYIMFDVTITAIDKNLIGHNFTPITVSLLVTESNTLAEVVYEIQQQIENGYKKYLASASAEVKTYFDDNLHIYSYIGGGRHKDGSFTVYFSSISSVLPAVVDGYAMYICPDSMDKDEDSYEKYVFFKNLYRFFNQQIPEDGVITSEEGIGFGFFEHCWDRKHLYVHSDITTNTNYQLIDRINTFYRKPSKIYEHNDSGNIFHIWVSFDGKHKQELKYDEIEIALCFMADVRRSYV